MQLPANFQWLNNIGELPLMIQEGFKVLGIKEIPGSQNNPEIMKFAQELQVPDIYKSDDKQAWCALSHNAIAIRAKKHISYLDRYDYLRALAFAKQGVDYNQQYWIVIKETDAVLGDSLIFKRPGGGHVGMYIGEDSTHYYVMGGNQNNMYSFTKVAKFRLYAIRRPVYINMPISVKKYYLKDDGSPVSFNEQ